MGTRSLTFVHDNTVDGVRGEPIVCIYQQFDGYFDGVGDDILTFLKGSQVVNGISLAETGTVFNGAGDLAARLITHFKRGDSSDAGGVYIEPPSSEDGDMGTEYAYHIYPEVGKAPVLAATDIYAQFTVENSVDDFVWPVKDEDGNYVPAQHRTDTFGPLTEEQRRALFASFGEVFGDAAQPQRIAFTAMVLGKDPRTEAISWSQNKPGALTADEASKVLDALDALSV